MFNLWAEVRVPYDAKIFFMKIKRIPVKLAILDGYLVNYLKRKNILFARKLIL